MKLTTAPTSTPTRAGAFLDRATNTHNYTLVPSGGGGGAGAGAGSVELPPLGADYPPALQQLAASMVACDPAARPTLTAALATLHEVAAAMDTPPGCVTCGHDPAVTAALRAEVEWAYRLPQLATRPALRDEGAEGAWVATVVGANLRALGGGGSGGGIWGATGGSTASLVDPVSALEAAGRAFAPHSMATYCADHTGLAASCGPVVKLLQRAVAADGARLVAAVLQLLVVLARAGAGQWAHGCCGISVGGSGFVMSVCVCLRVFARMRRAWVVVRGGGGC